MIITDLPLFYAAIIFPMIFGSILVRTCCRAIRISNPYDPHHHVPSSCYRNRLYQSLKRSGLSTQLSYLWFRSFSSNKIESYFSAIGGDSEKPPPDLTPTQVTNILRTNECFLSQFSPLVKSVECNQLASNHPIEDRLRVSRVPPSDELKTSETLMMGVFDGHGGGTCADVVSRRLFHYVTLSLSSDPAGLMSQEELPTLVEDLFSSPKPEQIHAYGSDASRKIRNHIGANELRFLKRYAKKLAARKFASTADRIKDAFVQCDADLSEEIEENLSRVTSNLLVHFYYSLAVSGSCATVLILQDNKIHVANTGDCRAVMGETDGMATGIKSIHLSHDHNSDNIEEIKRIHSSHPEKEKNNVIRGNRLLGQLMPLRAFGDFGYKWPVAKIKSIGLTKAFGPHVIPPFYLTPPYLTAEPEVLTFDLKDSVSGDRFVVLGTDGLWEQFESSREVLNQVLWHKSAHGNLSRHDVECPAESNSEDFDQNCATHVLRSSLCQQPLGADPHLDSHEMKRLEHRRLVSFLTLPESVVRNFRDDISLIIIHLLPS